MTIFDYVREVVQSAILFYLVWELYKNKRK